MNESSSPESSTRVRRRGCSWLEAVALSLLVAIVAVLGTFTLLEARIERALRFSGPGEIEVTALEQYGPNRNSLGFEEWIVRDYFQDRRGGIFLDVGANHYQIKNNTYYLETTLGWSGIAIDALEEFAPDYAAHRPNTRFIAMFASDVADSSVQFFVPENNLVASMSREFTERYGAGGKPRQVPTTTLTHVLDQAGM